METKEEEGLIPRHPASGDSIVPPHLHPSRRTDNGDDKEKQPPHSFSIEPSAIETATVTDLALRRVEAPESNVDPNRRTTPGAPPSKKNRPTAKGGSRKRLNRKGEIIKRHDKGNDMSSSRMILPGAVLVEGIATRSDRPSTPQISSTSGRSIGSRDSVVVSPGTTQLEPTTVAFLAPIDDDRQIESRIAQTVEERFRRKMEDRFRRRMEEGEVILASEVNDDESSTYCGLKKWTLLLLGLLSLLLIIGGVVGGVLSSPKKVRGLTPNPAPPLGDPLLEELLSLNATYDEDLWRFSDPESPQYQALAWAKNDTIITSPGRSTQDLLQRYVMAVLFYATNGPNWKWYQPYFLSDDDVCTWNSGTGGYGVYCRLDGRSVDELQMSDNFLVGQLPWELALLTYLEIINLSWNKLRGSLPTELCRLGSLTSINIVSNQLSGTIPTEIGQLLSLETLSMGSNALSGTTIPTEFGQLLSLKSLDATSNQLTGTIPTELGQLVSMTDLALYYNELTGTIPTELGRLLSVTYLSVEYNQLTGTIPTEFRSLQQLAMGSNQLTGIIPTEFGQLLSLEILAIWGNQLTGTIPSEFGQLISLTSLYMHNNQLTGTIPTELGQLTSLVLLNINSNQLTGAIPTEIARMGNLADVTFFENALTGSLDRLWFCVENRTWNRLEADCNDLECSCCQCW